MQLRIEQGRGNKGRYTLLSLVTLNLLTNLISITEELLDIIAGFEALAKSV